MSHAEVLHTFAPSATAALVAFVGALRYDALSAEVRHYARRHLLDTVGVMIAGAAGDVATRAEAVLASVGGRGGVPVPGRARRADLLDAAFLGGTAAHGIELDDGYRHGSAHCGCVVVPAVLAIGYQRARRRQRRDRGDRRRLRNRDHARPRLPSGPAPARLPPDQRGRPVRRRDGGRQSCAALSADRLGDALGIAASERRRPVRVRQRRRRHQAPARRPRLARGIAGGAAGRAGRRGPARRDRGARRVHAGLRASAAPSARARSSCRPPCRSASPTATSSPTRAAATSSRRWKRWSTCWRRRRSRPTRCERVEVETYRIAAEHAAYRLGRLRQRATELPVPDGGRAALPRRSSSSISPTRRGAIRRSPSSPASSHVTAPAEIDRLYPRLRPARVTVATARGNFTRQADEALGSRQVPLDDDGLIAKFHGLVSAGAGRGAGATSWRERLWDDRGMRRRRAAGGDDGEGVVRRR